ncbi:MAG: type II secretion system F family protein [Planctomycetota bacterium]|jgi:tight adherence protein B
MVLDWEIIAALTEAQQRYVVIAVATFGLILGIWLLAVLVWRRQRGSQERKVEQRLGLTAPEETGRTHLLRLWHDGHQATISVPGRRRSRPLSQRLERLRRDAGWTVPAQTVILGVFGTALLIFVAAYVITGHLLAGLCGAVGLLLVARAYLKRRIGRRIAMFESQFLGALELAVRSLRAGHPLTGACQLMSEEIPAPVGPVFARICQQQEMGIDLSTAIGDAASQSASPDLKLFATSVAIQLRSGGNLADMMDRLSLVIRERIRLNRRVRVLTAQTQFSKRILAALPLVLFAILNIINPQYVEPLYTTFAGKMLLVMAGLGVVAGVYIMNRMAVLRY